MLLKTDFKDLPQELVEPLKTTDLIIRSYLAGFTFILRDTARDENFLENHLLSALSQDYMESSISILMLAMEGLLNVCKRELRFLLEASIKICFVQQKSYNSSILMKLEVFEKKLKSDSISMRDEIDLGMLQKESRDSFHENLGRLYGKTCEYVHLTPRQIIERIVAFENGSKPGRESPADINALNDLLSRVLSCSLVFLFHSVPTYVAGDWFVEEDGATTNWYFMRSRFLAEIDHFFDYKHERKACLADVQAKRLSNVSF